MRVSAETLNRRVKSKHMYLDTWKCGSLSFILVVEQSSLEDSRTSRMPGAVLRHWGMVQIAIS